MTRLDPQAGARALRAEAVAVALDARLAAATLTGPDTIDFAQRVLSADLRGLDAGAGTRGALLTPKGGVVCPAAILRTAEGLLLVGPAAGMPDLTGALRRYAVMDEVETRPVERAFVGLYGPGLPGRLAAPEAASLLAAGRDLAHARLPEGALLVADRLLGVPGLLVVAPGAEAAAEVAARIAPGVAEADPGAYEIARVEAGAPGFGAELGPGRFVMEAGLVAAVSFDKGCYIGQEPVCRVHYRGRVQRRLAGIAVAGDRLPAPGEAVAAEGREDAGTVTSAARSPAAGPIALAFLHRTVAAPGTEVAFAGGGGGRVAALPFVETPFAPALLPDFGDPLR